MKFFRKSQAAMEFLMTYGWAILVVLVAIGALAYFGVLDPARFLPERCTGPAGLDCIDKATIDATNDYVEIVAKNNLGFDIIMLDVTTDAAFSASAVSTDFGAVVEDSAGVDGGYNADTGATAPTGAPPVVPAAGAGQLEADNGDYIKMRLYSTGDIDTGKFQADFTIYYRNKDTGLDHPVVYNVVGQAS